MKSSTRQHTLRDLLDRLEWTAVEEALVESYPGESGPVDRYEAAYERLASLEGAPCSLVLRMEHQGDEDEEWIEVYGEDGTLRADGELESFALEFKPWAEWLGVVVAEDLLRDYSEAEIVAHCLYEMTFIAFDEEAIQDQVEELSGRVRELEQMTPAEREKHLIPWEKVKADLMERLTE